jgi:aldose 1-epimerase
MEKNAMNIEIVKDHTIKSRAYFRIFTSSGMQVTLGTYGAAIEDIALPFTDHAVGRDCPASADRSEFRHSIVLKEADEAALLRSGSYAGRTLAPNAGRISRSALNIEGHCYMLMPNEGQNQLHGGPHNLAHVDWEVESQEQAPDSVRITFTAEQADGVDGYPGNRKYRVEYSVEDTGWIRVKYHAESDQATYINMSNHTYWNLTVPEILQKQAADGSKEYQADPCQGSGLRQELEISANNVVLNDDQSLPRDIIPVSGTAFDFRTPAVIAHMLHSEILRDDITDRQFLIGRGYNNAYILTRANLNRRVRGVKREDALKKACTLLDPVSGHKMIMMTDAPALVLYTGGYLDVPSSYIALEAQDIPDVGNLLPERMQITDPEHPFHREIRYRIS